MRKWNVCEDCGGELICEFLGDGRAITKIVSSCPTPEICHQRAAGTIQLIPELTRDKS